MSGTMAAIHLNLVLHNNFRLDQEFKEASPKVSRSFSGFALWARLPCFGDENQFQEL